MDGAVRTSVEGSVGTLVLDDPTRRNATSYAMYAAIPAAVEALATAGVRAIVLRGAGDEAFGAGSNIAEFAERRTGPAAQIYNAVEAAAAHALESLSVPVIALIHGPCMGGGLGLALCADLRYAADDAVFATPPARLGIGYPIDGAARLRAAIGAARATEMLLTARRIDAAEAAAIGLIHGVRPKVELDGYVGETARSLTRLAPLTLAAAKASLRSLDHPGNHELAAIAERLVDGCYASADYAEGIAAFFEKRRPNFVGR
jgi:enoyl-CoA hydratase